MVGLVVWCCATHTSGSSSASGHYMHKSTEKFRKAINNTVTFGNVRVSVYSARLFRIEWSTTGTFDDRPTMGFLYRDVFWPFTLSTANNMHTVQALNGLTLTLPVAARYTRFSHNDSNGLRIAYDMSAGKRVTWTPTQSLQCGTVAGQDRHACNASTQPACEGMGCCWDNSNITNGDNWFPRCYHMAMGGKGNLKGSVDTTDCDIGGGWPGVRCNEWYYKQLNEGLVSRDGWVVVDDTGNPALNSSDFDNGQYMPWRVERAWSSEYQDLYFFGHGHDYRAALRDFVTVSGPVHLMDVRAYGVWHSRYHAYSASAYMDIVNRYKSIGLPLNVAVLDMDWHTEPPTAGCQPYGGYVWNRTLFPSPDKFTQWLKTEHHLSVILNTHDQTGIDQCQGNVYDCAGRSTMMVLNDNFFVGQNLSFYSSSTCNGDRSFVQSDCQLPIAECSLHASVVRVCT
jgi:hypothetical protein